MNRRHLLGMDGLDRAVIEGLLNNARSFAEVTSRRIPRVPALRGRTVALMFFEDSTRTRLSFESAAKRMSADTLTFSASASSLNKGESLRDTALTVAAMGVDAMVVRHRCSGVAKQFSDWVDASVVNAGDGWHEHPTQALLDCYTLTEELASLGRHTNPLEGLRIGIVGDIEHSRVARSNVAAFSTMGARVTLIGPPTLLPRSTDPWPAEVTCDLDSVLEDLDVVYLLRLQVERMDPKLLPSVDDYVSGYRLDRPRAARLAKDALVLHPGPMNRGVEIDPYVADSPACRVLDQVRNGVPVRMAVLWWLLGASIETGGGDA